MNNNNANRRPPRPSPLPTWNAIHDPPSDDDLEHTSDRDDDIDMLDRNSVAPRTHPTSTSTPTSAPRSWLGAASTSNLGLSSGSRLALGSGSSSVLTQRRPTTTSTSNIPSSSMVLLPTMNTTTSSTMNIGTSTRTSTPTSTQSSLGLLKRKDKEHASDQNQISKRPKLSTTGGLAVARSSTSTAASGFGGSSGTGTGTGTGFASGSVPISRTSQTARKSATGAYNPPLLTLPSTIVSSAPVPTIKPRQRILHTARKSTGNGYSWTASSSMLSPGVVPGGSSRAGSSGAGISGSNSARISGSNNTPSIDDNINRTQIQTGNTNGEQNTSGGRQTDHDHDMASTSSSSPSKPRPRPRPVIRSSGSSSMLASSSSSAFGSGSVVGSGSTSAFGSVSAPVPSKSKLRSKPILPSRPVSTSNAQSKSNPQSTSNPQSKSNLSPQSKFSDAEIIEISSDSDNTTIKAKSKQKLKARVKSGFKSIAVSNESISGSINSNANKNVNEGSTLSSSVSVSSVVSARPVKAVIARKSAGGVRPSDGPRNERRGSPMSVIELSSDDDDDVVNVKSKSKPTQPNSIQPKSALAKQKEEEKKALMERIVKLREEVAEKRRREEEMFRGKEIFEVEDDDAEEGGTGAGDNGVGSGVVNHGAEKEVGKENSGTEPHASVSVPEPMVESGVDVQMHDEDDEDEGVFSPVPVRVDKGKGKETENENEREDEDEWNADDDSDDISMDLQNLQVLLEVEKDVMVVDQDVGPLSKIPSEPRMVGPGGGAGLDGVGESIIPTTVISMSTTPYTYTQSSGPAIPSTPPPKSIQPTSVSTPTPAVTSVPVVSTPTRHTPKSLTPKPTSNPPTISSPQFRPRSSSNTTNAFTDTQPKASPSNTQPKAGFSKRTILGQIAVKSTGRRMVPSSVSSSSGSGDDGSGSSSESGEEESESESEEGFEMEVEGVAVAGPAEDEGAIENQKEKENNDEVRMQVDAAARNVTPPPLKMMGVKQQVPSPVVPKGSPTKRTTSHPTKPESKKRQQTLAEAITLTGKANWKKQRRRERGLLTKTLRNVGNKVDEPIDLTSDVEEGGVESWENRLDKESEEMDDADPGPPPTTASSVGSFGGWSMEGQTIAGGSTQFAASASSTLPELQSTASVITSTMPPRSQVNERLLTSSRHLVNILKQKAAAKKQMRYTPSTSSSGHPSISPPTLSPRHTDNFTTSIDAGIQSMVQSSVDAGLGGGSDPSTPVQLLSPQIPTPSPPNFLPSSIPIGSSPTQITPLTQAVVGLGITNTEDAVSSTAPTNSLSDMLPPSLSRVGQSVGGGSLSSISINQTQHTSPNRDIDCPQITPVVSPSRSRAVSSARSQIASPPHQSVSMFASPHRDQGSGSPRSQAASPPNVSSHMMSPHRSPLYSAGDEHSPASSQSGLGQGSPSPRHSPAGIITPQRSPVRVISPQRSPVHTISPRRSSFASPKGKEIGHRRNPSAPNSSQVFGSTFNTGASPFRVSTSKPASPSSRSLLASPNSPSSSDTRSGEVAQSQSEPQMQTGKPPLPTRMPPRPSGMMSMSAVPTVASVQLGVKLLESSPGMQQKRAASVDTPGAPSSTGGTVQGVMGAVATMGIAPITKVVEPRTEAIVGQPLGVPAIAAPLMGMDDDDDDDFYVDDGPAGAPQLPPVSDDDDEAMEEIQELVSASVSDEEMMDVDYDTPSPHPPISEVPSSAGTPSSIDSSGPIRPNVFQRRVTRHSSSDGLFDPTSSPQSSSRTTPEETGIAAATTSTQQHQQPFGPVSKSYGGFPILFWPEERRKMRTYSKLAEPKYARDLPHKLQDHINSMSEHSQLFEGMREIFEATIQENTAEDEPDAPPIKITNDVDDEPTPPWEFYYTNIMWHGEGVPAPDIENLQGCDCEGVCGSKSKTCSCLARQREVTFEKDLEWVYDKNGRLNPKAMGYPIFECNDKCGCGEECRNRVVQHGRKVEVCIQKTPDKGWGIFAGDRKIPKGTFIGIYSGEIITSNEAHIRGIKYNKFGRTYLFDIDFYHLKTSKNWKSVLTVDAYHAGNFTRFLNHSCDPNCRLYACYTNEGNINKPLLAIFAIRDIEPREEICFSYSGDHPGEEDDDEEEEEAPGPSQESNNKDEDSDNENGPENDRVWEVCRCGAANCRGAVFKLKPA